MNKYALINDALYAVQLVFRNGKHFVTTFLPIFTVYFIYDVRDIFREDTGSGLSLLFLIAHLITWASFATTWHRLVLLDEHVSLINSFNLGARERSFIWRGILLGVMTLMWSIPFIVLLFYFGADFTDNIFALVSAVVVAIVFVSLWNRFILVLPATALDMKGFGFTEAWHSTREIWIQFAVGSLICFVPFIAALAIVMIVLTNAELTFTGLALVALGAIFQVAYISTFSCYLSLVFKRLVLEPMLDEEASAIGGAEN